MLKTSKETERARKSIKDMPYFVSGQSFVDNLRKAYKKLQKWD